MEGEFEGEGVPDRAWPDAGGSIFNGFFGVFFDVVFGRFFLWLPAWLPVCWLAGGVDWRAGHG